MAKSAPARHLRTNISTSVSKSGERGCRSGDAATPTGKAAHERGSSTRTEAGARAGGGVARRRSRRPGGGRAHPDGKVPHRADQLLLFKDAPPAERFALPLRLRV